VSRILLYGAHGFLPMEAFARGISTVSALPLIRRGAAIYGANDYEPCTVCIIFGAKSPADRILADQRQHNTPVLVLDLGYIKRGNIVEARENPGQVYWSVNKNGLNGWGDPPRSPMPDDRWQQLGLQLAPWQTPPRDGHYLVCGQKPHDAAIDQINAGEWLINTVVQLRELTAQPIVWRPHPEDPSGRRLPIVTANTRRSGDRPLADDLVGCAGVVAYNSNALVEALVAGVPVYVLGEGATCPDMGHHTLTEKTLAEPLYPKREQFFADLAYRQWTIPEIEQGLPWLHFFDATGEPLPTTVGAVSLPTRRPRRIKRNPEKTSTRLPDQNDFLSPEQLTSLIRPAGE
jgi:hypothetical protein